MITLRKIKNFHVFWMFADEKTEYKALNNISHIIKESR